jgi:hypothetical protein
MSMNPSILEAVAEDERDCVLRDVKPIRLVDEAMHAGRTEERTTKARGYRPRRPRRIAAALADWRYRVGTKIRRLARELR